jgi:hypothetical protein
MLVRRDPKLLDNVFCDFAQKKRTGRRDVKLLELL